jgi:hypothetical protein
MKLSAIVIVFNATNCAGDIIMQISREKRCLQSDMGGMLQGKRFVLSRIRLTRESCNNDIK